jgi:hypothetical protein
LFDPFNGCVLTEAPMTLAAENAYNAWRFFAFYLKRGSILFTVNPLTPNSFSSLEIQKP